MRIFFAALLTIFLAFTAIVFALAQRNPMRFAIVYSANHEVLENYDAYEISLDGHWSHRITNVMGSEVDFRYVIDSDCSANGDYLYFTANGLYRINRDGTGLISLETKGFYITLDLSPDDSTLVFSASSTEAYPDEHDNDLYIYDLLKQEPHLITEGTRQEGEPNWSPNGEKIVFSYGFNENDLHGIALMNPDGTAEKILIEDNFINGSPVWSPDGQSIVFNSNRDGYFNFYSVAPDGSNLRQITFYTYDNFAPIWSPDGRAISFSSLRTGNMEIFLLDIASGLTLQITDDTATNYNDCLFPNN